MYIDDFGCDKWENKFSTIKELLDYGYLEGECEGCIYFNDCKIKNNSEEIG